MARDIDAAGADAAHEIRDALAGRHVCPFCGAIRDEAEGVCPRCTMENTASTRQTTKSRLGPWYVLQTRNPAAPGMKFDTLLAFVRKGRVKARSIVRGPTTQQLWRFAAHVKGLSREFGVCYSCGDSIERSATVCPHCNRLQDTPANPDVFLEGRENDAPATGRAPVYRELNAAPLVAADVVLPSLHANRPQDPHDPVNQSPGEDGPPRKASDGFLTAADLAAAFKLDFQPREHRHKRPAPAPRPAAQEPRAPRKPRQRRHWVRLTLSLLLLATVIVASIVFHRDPAFRAKAFGWYTQSVSWTQQKWAAMQKPAPKPAYHPAPRAEPSVKTPSDQSHSALPQTQPTSEPDPWAKLYNQSGTPAPASTQKFTVAARTQPIKPPHPQVKTHHEGDADEVRALYGQALDAEAAEDWATAVKRYEQIKEYPSDLWPGDLNLRLREARQPNH
jgi:hypothetical protein